MVPLTRCFLEAYHGHSSQATYANRAEGKVHMGRFLIVTGLLLLGAACGDVEAVKGEKPPGACEVDSECLTGEFCAPNNKCVSVDATPPSNVDTAEADVGDGECETHLDCGTNMFCWTGKTCADQQSVGGTCNKDFQCQSFKCKDNVCMGEE